MAGIQAAPDLQTLQMATSLYGAYMQWVEAGRPKREMSSEKEVSSEKEASWRRSW